MKDYFCPNTLRGSLTAITAVVVALPSVASEQRQLDAHEHGVAVVNMALEGEALFIELESPAMNIVGFEHPPRTAEQKQAIASAIQVLTMEPPIIAANLEAQCAMVEADVRHTSDADHDDHDDHDEHDDESGHAEFVGQFRFSCEQPDKLATVRVGLFAAFPLTDEVEVSFLGPDVQTFMRLDAGQPVLRVRR